MRLGQLWLASVALGGLALVVAPGCRDATQVTLDISLAQRALCTETNGTSIAVGVEPQALEGHVKDGFLTTTTIACNDETRSIGTLVLTPGAEGVAAVIVIVAYGGGSSASCKPPTYEGCIVARRSFAFPNHTKLVMPVTIDPDCKNVPCDAFSTCRKGACFKSEPACNSDVCTEPGATSDGGTDEAGAIVPDAGIDGPVGPGEDGGAGGDGGGADSGDGGKGDGSGGDAGGSTSVTCMAGRVWCQGSPMTPPMLCSGPGASCCETAADGPLCSPSASCGALPRYCCSVDECGNDGTCPLGGDPNVPHKCKPPLPP